MYQFKLMTLCVPDKKTILEEFRRTDPARILRLQHEHSPRRIFVLILQMCQQESIFQEGRVLAQITLEEPHLTGRFYRHLLHSDGGTLQRHDGRLWHGGRILTSGFSLQGEGTLEKCLSLVFGRSTEASASSDRRERSDDHLGFFFRFLDFLGSTHFFLDLLLVRSGLSDGHLFLAAPLPLLVLLVILDIVVNVLVIRLYKLMIIIQRRRR